MKVLRIIPYLDFGGVEQVLANSVPFLVASSKMELMIIVLGNGGRVEKELVKKGVKVILYNQNPRIPNFKILYKLFRFIIKFKPDVVHCQAAEANFHGLIAANLAGVRVRIGEEIGFPNHHSYWRYIFRFVYKNATKVIAISQAVKDRIVELGEVEAEKVDVVYNPVDLGRKKMGLKSSSLDFSLRASTRNDKEKQLSFNEADSVGDQIALNKPFVFVTTCRLVPVKNLGRLLDAFARLCKEFPDKFIELWIVGDGPLREVLENLSKDLGIADKVKFWGFQENVYPFLERADVFVLPSLSEGSSVSLVEAMSVGLPSVVTHVGGTVEIIGDSESAFFIDPLDEEIIFNALSSCLILPKDQRGKLDQSAKNEAKRFSVEKYIESLLKLYQN